MATVSEHKYPDKRNPTQKEMHVVIASTESGAGYSFILRRNHIDVVQTTLTPDPKKQHSAGRYSDWYSTLNDAEKVQVFAIIMDRYRERSFGDNGFKGAAIGVLAETMHGADETRNGQSRLFIGTNTQRWASPYFKHCAEQNMINKATDTLAFEYAKHGKTPKEAQLKSIYIMQGVRDDHLPMACACGLCTDMLASGVMQNGTSPVITVPILTDGLRKQLLKDTSSVEIDSTSETIRSIPSPLNSGKCVAWQRPISALNADRVIPLTLDPKLQDKALDAIIKHAMGDYGLPERRGTRYLNVVNQWLYRQYPAGERPKSTLGKMEKLLAHLYTGLDGFSRKAQEWLPFFATPAEKAVENILLQRKSEASLDTALHRDGTVDLAKMNYFLQQQIADTLADRLMAPKLAKSKTPKQQEKQIAAMTPSEKKEWVRENMKSIRCVAIQLDDGTFHYAVQVEGAIDNSMPNAEVVALENAAGSLGRHGVRHVWAMEMNPDDIKNGRMHTSPKEGIERLSKRASPGGIDFTFIPFNFNGKGIEAVRSNIAELTDAKLYPGGHKGYLAAATEKQTEPATAGNWGARAKAQKAAAPTKRAHA